MTAAEPAARSGACWVTVEVESRTLRSGLVIPECIVWPDGRRFEVERVARMQRSRARGQDGAPWHYRVVVRGRERSLWHEPPYWRVPCGTGQGLAWTDRVEVDWAEARRLYGLYR